MRNSVVVYYMKDSYLTQDFIRGPTGMPPVTTFVSAGSGWGSTYSLGWEEQRINLEAEKSLEGTEYADDICLLSHKCEHMQKKLYDLWEESKKLDLEINPLKTE